MAGREPPQELDRNGTASADSRSKGHDPEIRRVEHEGFLEGGNAENEAISNERQDDQGDLPPLVGARDYRQHPRRGDDEGQKRRRGGLSLRRRTQCDRIRDKGRDCDQRAGGEAEAEHSPHKAWPSALVVGRQGQDEGGDADGEPARDGDVDRLEGGFDGEDHRQHGDDGRINRLRQEEIRHALDVAEHAPALPDHVGERRELVIEQNDLRDRTGCSGARSHRHPEVGVLKGEDVVDAVARHRHCVPGALKR